jgi:hypothetical protein
MFRNDSLLLLGLERFEGASVPVREAAPVADQENSNERPTGDPLGRFGLTSSVEEEADDDLARMGLVKGRHDDDDLGVLGLVMFLP